MRIVNLRDTNSNQLLKLIKNVSLSLSKTHTKNASTG